MKVWAWKVHAPLKEITLPGRAHTTGLPNSLHSFCQIMQHQHLTGDSLTINSSGAGLSFGCFRMLKRKKKKPPICITCIIGIYICYHFQHYFPWNLDVTLANVLTSIPKAFNEISFFRDFTHWKCKVCFYSLFFKLLCNTKNKCKFILLLK